MAVSFDDFRYFVTLDDATVVDGSGNSANEGATGSKLSWSQQTSTSAAQGATSLVSDQDGNGKLAAGTDTWTGTATTSTGMGTFSGYTTTFTVPAVGGVAKTFPVFKAEDPFVSGVFAWVVLLDSADAQTAFPEASAQAKGSSDVYAAEAQVEGVVPTFALGAGRVELKGANVPQNATKLSWDDIGDVTPADANDAAVEYRGTDLNGNGQLAADGQTGVDADYMVGRRPPFSRATPSAL